jgi:membrane-associated phospholipid phosphatase
MRFVSMIAILAGAALAPAAAQAQSALNLRALQGLAPFSALGNSVAGKAALAANLQVTGDIQTGVSGQPGLQPFAAQQAQALRDAFITGGNAFQLADGLGSKLGGAYQSLASIGSGDDGKTVTFTNITPAIGELIGYTATLTAADSNSGKFFFAGGLQKTAGPAVPVNAAGAAILQKIGGTTDVFGKAYGHPAGAKGADKYGDSRPFQTEPTVLHYDDQDFFGLASNNFDYLTGPAQDLTGSPAWPSGHTTYGYTESVLLAVMVPARYTQMITRGAEYGNSRIVLAAHYAMDVIAGRSLAYYDVAHLLANDPDYLNQKEGKSTPIKDYRAALKAARADLTAALTKACGGTIAACAAADTGRFSDPAKDEAFYESTQTYGLPVVYPAEAGRTEDVGKLAPQAGWLLKAAFPALSLAEADHILTVTEGPGGGFLDDGSGFGVYSRLDLYKAGLEAAGVRT